MSPAARPAVERFWEKVDKDGPLPVRRPDLGPCWLWTSPPKDTGYGQLSVERRPVLAHRFSWELVNGPVADGLDLDHLCRRRHCVRPSHMEPVTPRLNKLRGESPNARHARATACDRGHEWTAENTYVRRDTGGRQCRACRRDRRSRGGGKA